MTMTLPRDEQAAPPLMLPAPTAADLMSPNPVSISQDATVKQAAAILADRGFSAAPVVDEAGLVGVVSRSDVMIHYRNKPEPVPGLPTSDERGDQGTRPGEPRPGGSQPENAAQTRVRDIMTPAVFAVSSEAPARRGLGDMVGLKVHRVFVVGSGGVLVGVISAFDVVRHLR
jgi:CBS domain-containing protein